MEIVFLGTNGWYSTETGSTSCVLIESDKYYVVFDAGEGMYKLESYLTRNKPVHLFLSHFHLDHVFGFHTICKLKLNRGIDIYGQRGTRRTLNRLVQHPFTIPFRDLPFEVRVHELTEGTHEVPFPVTCRFLVHADPCYGYRVTLDGKVIAYLTDTAVCDNSLELCMNADLMIHECASKSGRVTTNWPHTTPREAAELAVRARVKQLLLCHFDAAIYRSVEDRKQAEAEAKTIFENTMVAFDGTTIRI